MQQSYHGKSRDNIPKESIEEYFGKLDADFTGIKKIEDETYSYRATDLLVQTAWELPIVIQWPKAVVNYEFSSTPGDISFGVVFVAAPEEGEQVDDLDMETVEEMDRVPSNSETISGSFELPCEGVVFFLWDNNYDWSAVKKISYKIEVKEPSFTLVDQFRSESSLKSMREVCDDLDIAYSRLADAQDCIQNNTANVKFLEDQLLTLQRKLGARKSEYQTVQTCIMDCYAVMHMTKESKTGLLIRLLETPILGYMLSFLEENDWPLVSKHWYEVYMSKSSVYSNSFRWYSHLTKSDIEKMKTQIFLDNVKKDETVDIEPLSTTNNGDSRKSYYDDGAAVDKNSGSSSDIDIDPLKSPKLKKTKASKRSQEEKAMILEAVNSKTEATKEGALTSSNNKSSKGKRKEEKLLQDVREIRNEQNQLALIEYVNSNYSKIENLLVEKRRLKRLIKAWNSSYEKEHGRVPTSAERKGHLRELHEEYQQVSLALKIREEKVEKSLKQMGLTKEQFEELRNSKLSDW